MRLHVEGQKFHGHLGTWHVVDTEEIQGHRLYLYEREQEPDGPWIVVDRGGAILCETEYYLHDSREVEEILDELEEEEDLP